MVTDPRSAGWYGDGLPRNARLGARSAVVFRNAVLQQTREQRDLQSRAETGIRPGIRAWARRDDVIFREGRGLVAVFDFGALPSSQLNVKVAISGVSEANAIANLDAEAPGWDFDAQRTAAAAAWRDALVRLRSRLPSLSARCCTHRYNHALMAPSVFMDVDGSYRGPDREAHHADGYSFRSTFSLWDTYRALHPPVDAGASRIR